MVSAATPAARSFIYLVVPEWDAAWKLHSAHQGSISSLLVEFSGQSAEPAVASQAAPHMSMDEGDPDGSRQRISRRERIYALAIVILVILWACLFWLVG